MAKFPIVRTERIISGRAPSVRANIDVRTGGQELGRAAAGLGGSIFELGIRKQRMDDALTRDEANKIKTDAENEIKLFRAENTDTRLWTEQAEKVFDTATGKINKLKASERMTKIINSESELWRSDQSAKLEIKEIERKKTDTQKVIVDELVEAYKSNDAVKIYEANLNFNILSPSVFQPGEAKIIMRNAITAGTKERLKNLEPSVAIGLVNKEIELRKQGKGKTPTEVLDREDLNQIAAYAAGVQNRTNSKRRELVKQATSQTINEFFRGKLTEEELIDRHREGLIENSEFKFMIKGLRSPAPDISDPFTIGKIRRAINEFAVGAIDRTEADKVLLENYKKLNNADRSDVVADLEDVEAKAIATAKSNAYSEGKGLMSRAFAGIETQDDLLRVVLKTPGLSEEKIDRLNRRWTAEVNNRDLYERAIKDKFRQMRKEGVSAIGKYESESLKILLQYQKRLRSKLEELESAVAKEQQKIIASAEPAEPIKKISEMTVDEKKKELARIRELKRLAE